MLEILVPKEPSDFEEALLLVDVWKFVTTMSGEQCVTMHGIQLMPKSRADNWDSLTLVSIYNSACVCVVRHTEHAH